MPTGQPTEYEWEKAKPRIENLHKREGYGVGEIQAIMRSKFGFYGRESEYVSHFQDWGWRVTGSQVWKSAKGEPQSQQQRLQTTFPNLNESSRIERENAWQQARGSTIPQGDDNMRYQRGGYDSVSGTSGMGNSDRKLKRSEPDREKLQDELSIPQNRYLDTLSRETGIKRICVRPQAKPLTPAFPQGATTTIHCDSEILDLVKDVPQPVESFLGGLLTLTAKQGVVEAMRCDDFLRKYHGDIGLCVRIWGWKFWIRELCCTTTIENVLLGMLYLGCLALRVPSYRGLYTSFLRGGSILCALQNLRAASDYDESSCWHSLFESAVIVTTDNSSVEGYCLEINTDIMIQLAAVQYPVRVQDGLVLMGYSTALVPIQRLPNGKIKWHLEINCKKSQLKTSDLCLDGKEWFRTLNLEDLRGTALLGWSSNANILLGTERLPCQVTWSSRERKYHRWELNNINLQVMAQSAAPFQIGGQVGFTFRKIPNTVRFSPTGNFTKLLVDSRNEPMILYDTEEKRAWLVSKLSVLHHMILAYCKSSGVQEGYPFASSGEDGGRASFRVLSKLANKDLVGYDKASIRVSDLLLGFSVNLSKTTVCTPKNKEIYGYEFMDIVYTKTVSELGKARLERDGLVWKPLLNHIECLFCKNLGDAIISMKSSDPNSSCNRLPKGRDLLAASLCCVNEISKREGNDNQTSIRRFPGSYLWELSGEPFSDCNHPGETASCWNSDSFIQDIHQEKKKFFNLRHEKKENDAHRREYSGPKISGVVVFGHRLAKATFSRLVSLPLANKTGKSNAGWKVRGGMALPQTKTSDTPATEPQRLDKVCHTRPKSSDMAIT